MSSLHNWNCHHKVPREHPLIQRPGRDHSLRNLGNIGWTWYLVLDLIQPCVDDLFIIIESITNVNIDILTQFDHQNNCYDAGYVDAKLFYECFHAQASSTVQVQWAWSWSRVWLATDTTNMHPFQCRIFNSQKKVHTTCHIWETRKLTHFSWFSWLILWD